MGNFTSVDGKQVLTALTLRENGRKRVHLALTKEEKKSAKKAADFLVSSSDSAVIAGHLKGLFNGPDGIWTFGFASGIAGTATLNVTIPEKICVVTLPVHVIAKTLLPDPDTEVGLLVRLFLSENRNPSWQFYNLADAKKSMQWMRLVLMNRLNHNPKQFGAPGAQSITDIVKAKRQFQGFESYPALGPDQQTHINGVVSVANDDNHPDQCDYADFLNAAIEAATGPLPEDPLGDGGFLAGWMTTGFSPGGSYTKFGDPVMANQFFLLTKA
jgi:hypothetical protein